MTFPLCIVHVHCKFTQVTIQQRILVESISAYASKSSKITVRQQKSFIKPKLNYHQCMHIIYIGSTSMYMRVKPSSR